MANSLTGDTSGTPQDDQEARQETSDTPDTTNTPDPTPTPQEGPQEGTVDEEFLVGTWMGLPNFGCPNCSYLTIRGSEDIQQHMLELHKGER